MSRKILYGLVVVAMLVMAFGVKGLGVQTAAAANSGQWYDARSAMTNTMVPYFNNSVMLNTGNGSADGDLGGCAVAPSFGAYQLHLLNLNSDDYVTYVRVRVVANNAADYVQNSWAVRVSANTAGLPELGCALNNASGVIDFVVAIPALTDVLVTLATNGIFVPSANGFVTIITSGLQPTGGLLINLTGDCGDPALRNVEATNVADAGNGDYYGGHNVDAWGFWLDVPAGTYNLGVVDQTANAAPVINHFAAYYPGIVVGTASYMSLKPCTDSVVPITVSNDGAWDVAHVLVTPDSFGLNHDLDLGQMGVATDAPGTMKFYVNPGYLWDLALFDPHSNNATNWFMYYNAFNPTLGTLIFHDTPSPLANFSLVNLCADSGYHDGFVTLKPAGQLNPRLFEWAQGPASYCGAGQSGEEFDLSPAGPNSPSYTVSDLYTLESGWRYYYTPVGGALWDALPVFTFSAPGPYHNRVFFTIGDLPLITTPMPNATSAEQYSLPLASGEVALQRGDWTDQAGDTLYKILAPDNTRRDCVTGNTIIDSGSAKDSIAPCYTIETVSTGFVGLANDWLTTNLGPVTAIGRYQYWRRLQHGDLTDINHGTNNGPVAGFFNYNDLFAISANDISMGGTWSWSWIEAMYEMGLTTGLTPTTYGPDLPVTRAEMAMFLARVMDMYGLPAGTAPAFTDVASSYWAHDAIIMLRSYGITDGCGSNMYCPEADVTRAEMAKFIESTFRTISAYGGPVYWDTSFHVLVPGLTFIDVPSTYWANTWIEELFWDNLTSGCMRDGLTLYYCPDANVTRGEMAKFIITAIQPAPVTQGFWPILSPSK